MFRPPTDPSRFVKRESQRVRQHQSVTDPDFNGFRGSKLVDRGPDPSELIDPRT